MISGTGRMQTEEQDIAFKSGESIYIALNEQHCFIADSTTPFQMICCILSKNRGQP
jgi:quercetin dioxygenase-like cupin family protein